MKDNIIMQIIRSMTPVLNNEQLNLLKETMDVILSGYNISPMETGLICADNNSRLYLRLFLEQFMLSGKSERSKAQYELNIGRFLDVTSKNVEEVNDADVVRYIYEYKKVRKVSQRYLNTIRLELNSFFKWLQRKNIISRNPVDGLEPIKYKAVIKTPFSAEEMEHIRCACNNERDIALVEFLYSTAVRVSECVNLNINDISWEDNDVIVLGKGNKEREVYINAKTNVHLKKYLESRTDDNPALFVSLKSPYQRLTKSGVEYILKRVGKRAGVKDVHPHRFRRTSATDLLNKGMPIEQVQELLGHTKIDTTRMYCTVMKEQVKASHKKYM